MIELKLKQLIQSLLPAKKGLIELQYVSIYI